MRKFTLLAAAALICVPAAAHADMNDRNDPNDFTVRVKSEKDFNQAKHNETYRLTDGEKLAVMGTKAYKIEPTGERFYAPSSTYYAQNGLAIVVEDGTVKRIVEPAETVYVDVDANQREGIDVETHKYKMKEEPRKKDHWWN